MTSQIYHYSTWFKMDLVLLTYWDFCDKWQIKGGFLSYWPNSSRSPVEDSQSLSDSLSETDTDELASIIFSFDLIKLSSWFKSLNSFL